MISPKNFRVNQNLIFFLKIFIFANISFVGYKNNISDILDLRECTKLSPQKFGGGVPAKNEQNFEVFLEGGFPP